MNRDAGSDVWWTVHQGSSPVLATAIHNGHNVRPAIAGLMAISEEQRLREEDPFTEFAVRDVPNRIIFHRSRFEVDLNRPRNGAVYLSPEQAWGLNIWNERPDPVAMADTLGIYDAYYVMLDNTLRQLETHHGHFVVLDIHSYNHRRGGPDAAPSDPERAPQINIGTYSMDRHRWAHVVDPFIRQLSSFRFRGQRMDVRENIAFEGRGEQTRFIHERFPLTGCAIAVEFKKFFMDEWSGEPDRRALVAMRAMIRSTLLPLQESLRAKR